MVDRTYHRALVDAGLVSSGSYGRGIPVWRERGLQMAQHMVDMAVDQFRSVGEPVVLEHSFLMPAAEYRRVFPDYSNAYGTTDARVVDECVFRPDNLVASVGWLQQSGHRGPLVAVGGLLRVLSGPAAPLFRDKHIWPSVQINQLVRRAESEATLDQYQAAIERVINGLGLPAVSIRTDALSHYGRVCYLAITCLPDGRPTVAATTFLMAERYRAALAVDQEVIDVGFTGKLLATAALHHRDLRGLALPSSVAPTQVGLIPGGQRRFDDRWLDSLRSANLRVDVADGCEPRFRRQRAEGRFFRQGTPLVVGVRDADSVVRVARRKPLNRHPRRGLPGPRTLVSDLADHDERIRRVANQRFHRGLRSSGRLRGACSRCIDSTNLPVFGEVTPTRPRPCWLCRDAGEEVLVSEDGRFY